MPAMQQFKCETEGARSSATQLRTLLAIPPSFFAITMGLAGLAGVWRLAGELYHLPAAIGVALYVVAVAVYLPLLVAFAMKLVLLPKAVMAELTHPVLGPFSSLLPMSGMLLALGLEPYAHLAALVLFLVFFITTVLLGGWMTGQWIVARLDAETFHPGYLLPTVAGALVGANGAGHFGMLGLGWMSFGIGIISWVVLGSITLNRLFFQSGLPAGLVPTLAIEMAPPVVAGNAYFTLTGGRIDLLAYVLAGYAVLMVLVQVRLAPLYWRTPFAPSFWAFTFSYAAVASDAMCWIEFEHTTGRPILGFVLLAAITLLIGGIASRSLIALRQGTFLPAS
jgi:tellurite resistance protein